MIMIFRNGRFNINTVQNLVGLLKKKISINWKPSGLNHKKHKGTQEDIQRCLHTQNYVGLLE